MPHITLTIGDPTGIGPEITVKALQRLNEFSDLKLTVIGSMKSLAKASDSLKLPLPQDSAVTYQIIEANLPGSIAYKSIDTAVKLIADKKADALVTGPISKRNLQAADYKAHGHTEILEELAEKYFSKSGEVPSPLRGGLGRGSFSKPDIRNNGESPPLTPPVKGGGRHLPQSQPPRFKAEMLFIYKNFRLMLLTRHIALKDVPAAVAKSGAVAKPLKTLISFLRNQLGVSEPQIAILGVNPHSGEIGGDEEEKYFLPIIRAVNNIGNTQLKGPFAADGFFRGFDMATNPYDAIVATYHDQGLIPFKMLAGYEAVNMTIGLPFIRTSVSHGTAEDIEGKGVAREDSLIAALHAALETL